MKLSPRTEHLSDPLFMSNLWTTLVIPVCQIFQLPWALAPSSSPLDLIVSPHFPSSATSSLLRPHPPMPPDPNHAPPPPLRIPPCWCQTLKRTTVRVCVRVCSCVPKGQAWLPGRWALQQLSAPTLWAPSPPQSFMGKQLNPPSNLSCTPSLPFSLCPSISLHLSIPPSPSLPLFQTIVT